MAALGELHLDNVFIQLDYGDGIRYLDRCGETVYDLCRVDSNWAFAEADPQSGSLYHIATGCTLSFNAERINLTRGESDIPLPKLRKFFLGVCHVIRRNLAFNELLRIGYRTTNLVQAQSVEDAEDRIRKWGLFTVAPRLLEAAKRPIKNHQHVVVFEESGNGVRFSVNAITREQARSVPNHLLKKNSNMLRKNQREAYAAKLSELARYRKDPRFAVMFDFDFYQEDPVYDNLESFLERSEESRIDFLKEIGVRL